MPHTTTGRAQQTLARETRVHGIGFVSETDVNLIFRPAPADTGIIFRRIDLPGSPEVPALIENVVPRQRRTPEGGSDHRNGRARDGVPLWPADRQLHY